MNKRLTIFNRVVADLRSWTATSWHYEIRVIDAGCPNVCSDVGWIDVQFPCSGEYELRIAAFVDQPALMVDGDQPPTLDDISKVVFMELAFDDTRSHQIDAIIGDKVFRKEFNPGAYY